MAKTRRLIKECLPLVDIVVELRDARIPKSSSNPDLGKWIGDKKRIVVLNKCDTADTRITAQWLDYYRGK
ncbi:MAG: ribosome biogenesis GTPase YlqF, partial [Oscillospiraceae bacterium]